jgi:hypothetical protein
MLTFVGYIADSFLAISHSDAVTYASIPARNKRQPWESAAL